MKWNSDSFVQDLNWGSLISFPMITITLSTPPFTVKYIFITSVCICILLGFFFFLNFLSWQATSSTFLPTNIYYKTSSISDRHAPKLLCKHVRCIITLTLLALNRNNKLQQTFSMACFIDSFSDLQVFKSISSR